MEFLDMNFYMAQAYYLGLVLLYFGATYWNVKSHKEIDKKQDSRDDLYRIQIIEIYKISFLKKECPRMNENNEISYIFELFHI